MSVEASDHDFYYITDVQFSVRAMVPTGLKQPVIERTRYEAYGRAQHHHGFDANLDGFVDSDDVSVVSSQVTAKIDDGLPYFPDLDFNRSGEIDWDDLDLAYAWEYEGRGSAVNNGITDSTRPWQTGLIPGPDNPVGYCGYQYVKESSLYSVRFRWYDPATGRWLQRDPAGYINGMNRYKYVMSNPRRFVDRSGMAAEEPAEADPQVKDQNAIYSDPSRGCGIKVKQNNIGNGYGHRWIEIAEPDKPTRSLGFYPSGSKNGKDKGSMSAFGGKGVWMSRYAKESDSDDTCDCKSQNDPAHGQPGDTVWDTELDPTYLVPDEITGGDGLDRGPGGRPLDPPKIISWKIVERKLRFGSGKDTLVKEATCDQIRECLDRFLSRRSYIYGVSSCRGVVDEALGACGLKRK